MRPVRGNRYSGGLPPGRRRLQITEPAPAHAGTRVLCSCAAFPFKFGTTHEGIHRSPDPATEGLTDTSGLGLSKSRAIR